MKCNQLSSHQLKSFRSIINISIDLAVKKEFPTSNLHMTSSKSFSL